MTDSEAPEGIVPCHTIEPVRMTAQQRTLQRVSGQTAFAAFNDWAHHEARRLCEPGRCVTGTCRGHVDVSDWRVVEQDGDAFTCEFTAEFFCRCD